MNRMWSRGKFQSKFTGKHFKCASIIWKINIHFILGIFIIESCMFCNTVCLVKFHGFFLLLCFIPLSSFNLIYLFYIHRYYTTLKILCWFSFKTNHISPHLNCPCYVIVRIVIWMYLVFFITCLNKKKCIQFCNFLSSIVACNSICNACFDFFKFSQICFVLLSLKTFFLRAMSDSSFITFQKFRCVTLVTYLHSKAFQWPDFTSLCPALVAIHKFRDTRSSNISFVQGLCLI